MSPHGRAHGLLSGSTEDGMSDPVPQILLATDFSDGAAPAAEVAADYARRLGARLHVLHVTHRGWEGEMLDVLRDYVRRFTGLAVTATVETGCAAERIVACAECNRAQLIVLGAHGRTGFTRALLGSVAERVARTAHCPVMTVPRDLHAEPLRAPRPGAGALTLAEPPPPSPHECLVCSAVADELICESCRARIRGEAYERKWPQEKVRA
jgi:nucleotide-binding universal stress UspA family protein